ELHPTLRGNLRRGLPSGVRLARRRWMRSEAGFAFQNRRDDGSVRVLIIDDEPLARRGVHLRLKTFKDIRVIGECGDGASAVKKILMLAPDLIFLDVQMPEMDGFEVLRALPADVVPAVIFLTAYEQHAVRAFEVHALDYLVK